MTLGHWSGLDTHHIQLLADSIGGLWNIANAAFLRRWARVKHGVHHHVESFDISQASCFDENDRPLVQRNVAAFMKFISRVPRDASEQDGLQAFNVLVQEELPQALMKSFGRSGVPYGYVLCMMTPVLTVGMDVMAADIQTGKDPLYILSKFLDVLSRCFLYKPLVYAALARLMQKVLWLGGCSEMAFVSISGVAMWFLYARIVAFMSPLWLKASIDNDVLRALSVSMCFLLMLTYWLYRSKRLRKASKTSFDKRPAGDVELGCLSVLQSPSDDFANRATTSKPSTPAVQSLHL